MIALVSDQWPLWSVSLQILDDHLLLLQYNEDVLQILYVAGFKRVLSWCVSAIVGIGDCQEWGVHNLHLAPSILCLGRGY